MKIVGEAAPLRRMEIQFTFYLFLLYVYMCIYPNSSAEQCELWYISIQVYVLTYALTRHGYRVYML